MKTLKLKDEPTILAIIAIILAFAALWAVGCGGGGAYSAPTTPSTTTTSNTAAAATVNIVGLAGNTAFNPNPIQAASGTTLAWKNTTGVAHHIVMDSGTVVGDVASAPANPMPNSSGGYDY